MRIKLLLIIALVTSITLSFGQNPIIESSISDPHVRVFNDTIYLYSGHDATPQDKLWVMKDWRVYSTTDLVNWNHRTTISPKENYMDDNSSDCWASDAAERNGKYYFYFSDQKRGVGVMTANSPTGPFVDELGKPIVSPMHDPTAFIDSDKNNTPYLLYGDKEGGGFHIAELNEDMISTKEDSKPIIINGAEWEEAPHWMDKNYIFKHKDTYYLSWGRDYATANNVYGPYQCVGAMGVGHKLNQFAHGSFFSWKGQFYHIWCYYIKQGFKYRESIISYCHIDESGKVYTDTHFLDKHFANGVGQYKANWDRIEAEWFYEVSGNVQKQKLEDGFAVSELGNGNWLRFANVSFEKEYNRFVSKIAFKGKKGILEIRKGSAEGEMLGKVNLKESPNNATFQDVSCEINTTQGKYDIYLVFKSSGKSNVQLDWMKFQ